MNSCSLSGRSYSWRAGLCQSRAMGIADWRGSAPVMIVSVGSTCHAYVWGNEPTVAERSPTLPLRVLFASDLHLEFTDCPHPDVESVDSVDLVVAAGDIGAGSGGLVWLASLARHSATPVVYVAGNHEFHYHDRLQVIDQSRELAACIDGLHFLENDSLDVTSRDGEIWRILGATLWTDFEAGPLSRPASQQLADASIRDFRLISENGQPFTTLSAIEANRESRSFIETALDRAGADQRLAGTVVVTHHPPLLTPWSRSEFLGDERSPAFCNEWPDLFASRRAQAWIAGHTHKPDTDQIFKGCRLLGRQCGFPGENWIDDPFEFASVEVPSRRAASPVDSQP